MNHTKCYKQNYPRPQFVRSSFDTLNGEWLFAYDDGDKGEQEQWYKTNPFKMKITVPFSYHTALSGIGDSARHDNVWYGRELPLKKSDFSADEQYILYFEGSDYRSKVWINGNYVGENLGGYHRFGFEISEFLTDGKNFLTVKVSDSFDTDIVRGKQRWQKDSYACFYTETTGIWKTVWGEKVSKFRLEEVKITPDIDSSKVGIAYNFNVICHGLSVETAVSYQGTPIAEYENKVTRKQFGMDFSLISEAAFFKVFYWQTYLPALYDVVFTVKKDGKVIDSIGSYFGFRKAEAVKNSLNVNNRPEYLRMVLDQAYYPNSDLTPPDEESIVKDVLLIKELGFNGIRKHQKIEDDRFYYYCDILGMYVFLEMPSAYEFTDSGVKSFTEQWVKIVSQHYNFASIICYVPFNESWGIFDVYNNKKQQAFTESIYYLTKALDCTRSVISNDGWEHTKSDIVSLHNYAERGEDVELCYGCPDKVLNDTFISGKIPKFAFCRGYGYEGQPVMLSEYAGVAFQKDQLSGWGYGNMVKSEEEFLDRIESLTNAIKALPYMMGYCITQFTDVQQEVNGLFDIHRNCKVKDYDRLKRIFS